MLTILALPFRLVAALIAIPTKLSARLLRFSTLATLRTTRFALRSSLVSFAAGAGAGWFLTTPTGRDLVSTVRERIQGGSSSSDTSEPAADVEPPVAAATTSAPDLQPADVDLPADAPADEVAGATPAV